MKAQIELKALKILVDATKEFIGTSDARPTYQYIRIDFSVADSSATATAVDGYRLSVEHAVCTTDEDFTVFIKPYLPRGSKNSTAVIELLDNYAYIKVDGNVTGYQQPKGDGFNHETVLNPLEKTAPSYRIGFNGTYLLSALRAARASCGNVFREPIVLEFRSPTEPAILRTGKNNVKLVLPIRIKEDTP